MLPKFLNSFFSKPAAKPALPRVPDGTRYYVIGDIHGRLDLFNAMIHVLEQDDAARPEAETHFILLGDLVDRGPDSAGVVRRARKWTKQRNVRILAGNHEEMFLRSFEDIEVMRHYFKHGGRETAISFGIKPKRFKDMSLKELFKELPKIVPKKDRVFIESFEEMIVAGDYVFVHAGIDPSQSLEDQNREDLLWIRDRFLDHKEPFSKVVVHGHTIFKEVVDCGNRIGIDTGAFRTGVLSALMLEGDQRRIIQTIEDGDKIRVKNREYNA